MMSNINFLNFEIWEIFERFEICLLLHEIIIIFSTYFIECIFDACHEI